MRLINEFCLKLVLMTIFILLLSTLTNNFLYIEKKLIPYLLKLFEGIYYVVDKTRKLVNKYIYIMYKLFDILSSLFFYYFINCLQWRDDCTIEPEKKLWFIELKKNKIIAYVMNVCLNLS